VTASGGTPAWIVGLAGLAIAVAVALRVLIPNGGDPTIFLALGDRATIQTEYARELLGDVVTRGSAGHDGKFFFAQANDPWFLDPDRHASVLDRTLYRGQRMLYPLLAGGLGAFPPRTVVWAMLVVNIAALGIATFLAARLAARWQASPWLGLAVALNPGLLFEIWIGGAGIVAYAFCLGAVLALEGRRTWAAALLLAGGALTREVMLAFGIGLVALGWLKDHRPRWRLILVPVACSVVWNVYLRVRLAGVSGVGGGPVIFDAPFLGLWQAFTSWLRQPADLVFNLGILVVIAAFTIRTVRGRSPLAWGALPFAALAAVLSVDVWQAPFDLSRALAPVLTASAFLLLARSPEPTSVRASGAR
jgi:hypothetical protein